MLTKVFIKLAIASSKYYSLSIAKWQFYRLLIKVYSDFINIGIAVYFCILRQIFEIQDYGLNHQNCHIEC